MRLSDLVDTYDGPPDPVIAGLTQDSRQVKPGWLFAALPGHKDDGARYIADAVRNGAVAVLAAKGTTIDVSGDNGIALLVDEHPRRLFAQLSARFFGAQPDVVAAVTGTNGKTSTVLFTQQIWAQLGLAGASIGTLGVRGPGLIRSGSLTTPDPVALHAELADLAAAGITHLAMEASSHGLHQRRLDGVKAQVAGFTNLSHDHLDYHGTMAAYLEAKAHLFDGILQPGGTAVLNADIPEYETLRDRVLARDCRVLSYGKGGTNIVLQSATPTPQGQAVGLAVGGVTYSVILPLVGAFQVMNALCALGLVIAEDAALTEQAVRALAHLTGAPGRLEYVPGHQGGGAVYVDYAHTPDALTHVLEALRPHTAGRLICVIGCGGDRDPHKRPLMGAAAAQLADLAVITDDNPRSEDPAVIRAAMMAGIKEPDQGKVKEIGDRRAAIQFAVKETGGGDVLVVAGKGHEQGQIIGEQIEPFDDVAEVKKSMGLHEGAPKGA